MGILYLQTTYVDMGKIGVTLRDVRNYTVLTHILVNIVEDFRHVTTISSP